MTLLEEITAKLGQMPEKQKRALYAKIKDHVPKFIPNEGPQSDAYFSDADVLLYGGSAGGGKTALGIGLAFNEHQHSALARRQYTDLVELINQAIEINGTRDGFNGSQPPRLRTMNGRLLEFIAATHMGDEQRRQGIPIDFLYIDEAAQFHESQVRFWMGWLRRARKSLDEKPDKQRKRCVLGSNPPLSVEGAWLIEWFAPWLDPGFPNPARPGELRWVITDEDGKDKWVDGPEPVLVGSKMVEPISRTFIPASLKDNPFLAGTGYEKQLDAFPEPMRSALRDGNFMAARQDHDRQVIPTAWIRAAHARWTPMPPIGIPMCAMGVDASGGGTDPMVISPRHDGWYAPLIVTPAKELTPERIGAQSAGIIVSHRRDQATVVVDLGGGYGGPIYERLIENKIECVGYKGAEKSTLRTQDRKLAFRNVRTAAYWKFREALNPDQFGGSPIALPPDGMLDAELAAPTFEVVSGGIELEKKDDVIDKLGRSPDRADAVVMAWYAGEKYVMRPSPSDSRRNKQRPQLNRGHDLQRRR
mgnify:FL=1